jgi:6-phosphogluconolactonase
MKRLFLFLFVALSLQLDAQQKSGSWYLVVGTYTTGKKSEGIYVYDFNPSNANVKQVGTVTRLNDPSFLAFAPGDKYLYAVNERGDNNGNGGKVTAFRFNKGNGHLDSINTQPSGGDNPCYVSVGNSGKWITVGNYSSGTLSVLPVGADGALESPTTLRHEGKGPNAQRQEKAHVHATVFSPDGKYLFVPDLGIDQLTVYRFDKGHLTEMPAVHTPPGSGPRHFTFSPNGKFAYLIKELSGSVTAYRYDGKGGLKEIQDVSSHPSDYSGTKGSADIHLSPDGKFLYASNRGDANSLAIFKVDATTGKLTVAGFQSTLGKTPRNFTIDPTGNYLLVGHQNTDDIVVFKRDKATGLLTDTGKRIPVGSAVCLKWVRK